MLELKVCLRHVDGPGKLVPLALIVDFVHLYLHVFTPGHMREKIVKYTLQNKYSPVGLLIGHNSFSVKHARRYPDGGYKQIARIQAGEMV